jgi:hypothetical protein
MSEANRFAQSRDLVFLCHPDRSEAEWRDLVFRPLNEVETILLINTAPPISPGSWEKWGFDFLGALCGERVVAND